MRYRHRDRWNRYPSDSDHNLNSLFSLSLSHMIKRFSCMIWMYRIDRITWVLCHKLTNNNDSRSWKILGGLLATATQTCRAFILQSCLRRSSSKLCFQVYSHEIKLIAQYMVIWTLSIRWVKKCRIFSLSVKVFVGIFGQLRTS